MRGRGTLVPLNKRILILLADGGTLRLLSCFDVELAWGLFALTCSNKVNFKNGRLRKVVSVIVLMTDS